MTKLKIALLEDSPLLLKDLKENAEDTGLVDVVAWATNSADFLEKIENTKPDVLLLDIDLPGDSMSGLDIAQRCKIPVLFVSGKTKDNLEKIEDMNWENEFVVEHISKPVSKDRLKHALLKMIRQLNTTNKDTKVFLNFKNNRQERVDLNTIVYMASEKENGSDSNNKVVYFKDRKPEVLIDFSFKKMEEKGFDKKVFITTHGSYRVNVNCIKSYDKKTHDVMVEVMEKDGKTKIHPVPVSESYLTDIRNRIK